MYKLKYYSLTKDEKKKLKEDFYKTEFGESIKMRLNRLFIIGILGILFSIYLFITSENKWNTIYAIILVMASLIFIGGSFSVRIQKLNDYLIKKKK